ncbi:unnamed protein product, partial [Aureobasidium vineae]
ALRTVSKAQNGVGAFILQCKRLDFHYCDWAGSSKGMKYALLRSPLEITVSPRPRKHPVIKGTYINGREKAICVRSLEKEQIMKKAELLRDASGDKLRKVTKPVRSMNESVRGIWDPFHGSKWSV